MINLLIDYESLSYLKDSSFSSLHCDEDGFSLKLNADPALPHFLHRIPLENITNLLVYGGIELR